MMTRAPRVFLAAAMRSCTASGLASVMVGGSGTWTRFISAPSLNLSSLRFEMKEGLQIRGAGEEIERRRLHQAIARRGPGRDLARDLVGSAADVHDPLRPTCGERLDNPA